MTYEETIEYMYQQLPMFHRVGKSAYKANLDTALFLDKYFDFPHKSYKTIHVAGTNGKGSVSHTLAAIFQTAGYKTGLFTSPHLVDFRERIRVNGQMIPEDEVALFIGSHHQVFDEIKPSFFEMTSALAFYYFKKVEVDIAIIEVGMGGRLDSTNVINPVLSVITNIGLDHTEFLGDTLAKIAIEKAGIIKPQTPVIIGQYKTETWPVFSSYEVPVYLAEQQYKIYQSGLPVNDLQRFQVYSDSILSYSDLELDLTGFYQRENICTVLMAVDILIKQGFHIQRKHIYEACHQVTILTGLKGRWQILGNNPLIICDTGHNKDGITWLVKQIRSISCKRLHIVIGFVNDKDISGILTLLPSDAVYYFTNASIPRAMNAGLLAEMAGKAGLKGSVFYTVREAFEAAKLKAGVDDFIFIGGSTFVVAEVLS